VPTVVPSRCALLTKNFIVTSVNIVENIIM
jgi:hypothetical protein